MLRKDLPQTQVIQNHVLRNQTNPNNHIAGKASMASAGEISISRQNSTGSETGRSAQKSHKNAKESSEGSENIVGLSEGLKNPKPQLWNGQVQ